MNTAGGMVHCKVLSVGISVGKMSEKMMKK